ncbi:hypothetical protein RI129_004846 [Pyrocoelia pectoralis]|uniref:Uncharacterized protein n=1 Tax=Pyrocoelia pectoralis TaxID=417401 RepID=A0AAN7ZJS6_9COLE
MELDFSKICRVCLNEGIMMSIFKVNVSKKMMACSSVQVWQNDGLPGQICNKCLAKLHISFQFKKQCEKSDAKLRQYMLEPLKTKEQQTLIQPQQEQVHHPQIQQSQQQQPQQQHTMTFQASQPQPTQNCVYIECAPLLDLQEQKFDGLGSISQPLTQLNYNVQSQNHLPITSYTLPPLGQVQVYNGSYTMPVQQIQTTNDLQNQVVVPPLQLLPQMQPIPQQQPDESILHNGTNNITCDPKDKVKRNVRVKREVKDNAVKQCPTCNKVFQTSTKLSRHMKTHSTDMPYKCKVCNKAFSHSGNFKIHLRMHTDERPFRCTVCDKGCRQAQDLEKHMRTHTGFNGSSTLIVHRRSHTGERPYVCQICNKGFAQSSCLVVHMKRHNGEKNFVCLSCNKSFVTNADLKEHSLIHSGDKPFGCNMCDKRYSRANDLNRHTKTHSV